MPSSLLASAEARPSDPGVVSYAVLALKFDVSYVQLGRGANALFAPTGNAIWAWAPRYMDWSITVPLLMIELIGVSALTGVLAQRVRASRSSPRSS